MPDQDPAPTGVPPDNRELLASDDVAKVAKLALLNLSDGELQTFTGQLDAVLHLADRLESFDLDDVPPTAHPFGVTNIYRDDVAEVGDEADEMRRLALEGGPDIEDGRFKVPPALGEAP